MAEITQVPEATNAGPVRISEPAILPAAEQEMPALKSGVYTVFPCSCEDVQPTGLRGLIRDKRTVIDNLTILLLLLTIIVAVRNLLK